MVSVNEAPAVGDGVESAKPLSGPGIDGLLLRGRGQTGRRRGEGRRSSRAVAVVEGRGRRASWNGDRRDGRRAAGGEREEPTARGRRQVHCLGHHRRNPGCGLFLNGDRAQVGARRRSTRQGTGGEHELGRGQNDVLGLRRRREWARRRSDHRGAHRGVPVVGSHRGGAGVDRHGQCGALRTSRSLRELSGRGRGREVDGRVRPARRQIPERVFERDGERVRGVGALGCGERTRRKHELGRRCWVDRLHLRRRREAVRRRRDHRVPGDRVTVIEGRG